MGMPRTKEGRMEIEFKHVEGIRFLIPKGLQLPLHANDFPDSCGPGHGWMERLIPEEIHGVRITPACWIHDKSWTIAKATRGDFHLSNCLFLWNIAVILEAFPSPYWLVNAFRGYRMVTYFLCVNGEEGKKHFEDCKKTKIWSE